MSRREPTAVSCCERTAPRLRLLSSLPTHSVDSSVLFSLKRRYAVMASATATATMAAAAGFDKRASTASSLQTPGSASFPSETLSPMIPSPNYLKDDLKTPITPPSAYLDFLNKTTPAMMSPAPTSAVMSPALTGNSSRFSFADKPAQIGLDRTSISPPLTAPLPSLSRNTSYDSQSSVGSSTSQSSAATNASSTAGPSTSGIKRSKPESPRVVIPLSPFAKPAPPSARSARAPRLRIPQSPFSPALGSAHSVHSGYSVTPVSAAPWSTSFSPREPPADIINPNGKVSVRQVVTRTVTYCRTPLEPAPKGKRRKIEVEEGRSESSSDETQVKEEKSDGEKEVDEITPSTSRPAESPPTDPRSD